jgi:hypothetical protein
LPARWEASALDISPLEISQEGRNRQRPPKVLSPQRPAPPEPPENLLVALVTQKPPQSIFKLAFGTVGLGRKLGRIFSGEVNTILFETTDQSVHIILK